MTDTHPLDSGKGPATPTASLLRLQGTETLTQSPDEVWKRLTDFAFLPRCLPDLERVVRSEPQLLVCRVRPGFSFLRGSLELTFEPLAASSSLAAPGPLAACWRIRGKGMASSVTVQTQFDVVTATPEGSQLNWTADVVELGGLLKPVGRSLIEAAARKVISDSLARLRQELDRCQ